MTLPGVVDRTVKVQLAQELCESRVGRPGLPVPNSPCGFFGRKATLNLNVWFIRDEGPGGRGGGEAACVYLGREVGVGGLPVSD